MSFLENMNNNPEFLNDFLKYSAYITFKSNLTVDEMYLDIRTFFRYLIFSKNENNVEFDINTFKTIDISEITLNDMKDVSSQVIDNYLYFVKNSLDNSAKTRNRKLASLKKLFMYLDNQNLISINPVRNASCAKVEKRHPKYLNFNRSKKLLADSIQTEKRNKIRDYAITCIFLNCCIRANELVLIDLTDVKMDERTIRIHGKGNTDRIIYMDDAVIEAISEYLKVRPNLNKAYPDRNALFLSNRKQRISKRNVQEIIKNELKLSFTDTADKYHTHTLRHTGATLMYDENNTDILIIKEILGHKSICSTEIYTHVANKRLRELMQNFNVLDLGGNKNE